jgi:hypothetical protein
MEPNPAQVPADGDADARAILDLARDGVTADLLGCMIYRDARVLSLYGARNVTVALRRAGQPRCSGKRSWRPRSPRQSMPVMTVT